MQRRDNAVCVDKSPNGFEISIVNSKGKFLLSFEDNEEVARKTAERIYGNLE